MGTNRFNIEDWNKKSPFKVPEGYMEGLSEQVMKQLPERSSQEEKVVSFSDKVRPWLYLAASFVGLILLFKGISMVKVEKEQRAEPSFYVQTAKPESSIPLISEEDRDFLEFLEMQYTDKLFLEELENIE